MFTLAQVMVLLLLQAVPLVMVGAVGGAFWMRRRMALQADPPREPIGEQLAALSAAIERIEQAVSSSSPVASLEDVPRASGVRVDRAARSPLPAPRQRDREPQPEKSIDRPTLISVPDLTGPGRGVGSQAEAARNSSLSNDLARRFARIWGMADRGASADRIAAATGQPIGQVELVLNLRRRLLDDPSVEVPE